MNLSLTHFLVLSVLLLAAGIVTIVRKRHPIGILLGIQLILAAANLNLVAFSKFPPAATSPTAPASAGQTMALFVTVISVAQLALALALFWNLHRSKMSVDIDVQNTKTEDINNPM